MSVAPSLFQEGWLAESVRVTFFVHPNTARLSGLADLFGMQPDQINDRPIEAIHQEVASYDKGILILVQAPGRVDLIYSANQRPGLAPLLHVGPLEDAFIRCSKMGELICEKIGPVTRIAIAPIAIQQVKNEPKSTELILRYFPELPVDPTTDLDVVWQFTRRRDATSFKGRINHVCRWQAHQTQLVAALPPAPVFSPPVDAVTVTFVRVEFDVNTLLDNPAAQLGPNRALIYQEIKERTSAVLEGSDL